MDHISTEQLRNECRRLEGMRLLMWDMYAKHDDMIEEHRDLWEKDKMKIKNEAMGGPPTFAQYIVLQTHDNLVREAYIASNYWYSKYQSLTNWENLFKTEIENRQN